MSEEAATDLTRVIEKIRKLLALATSANEHEATAALAQAQKLMDAHRISMDAVEGAAVGAETIDLDTDPVFAPASKHARWKVQLFCAIATHNGCRPVARRKAVDAVKGRLVWHTGYVSVGRESDRLMTRFMFEFCSRAVESLAKQNAKTLKSMRERQAYRWGVVISITESLVAARRRDDQYRQHMAGARASSCSALAIVDRRGAEAEAHLVKQENVQKKKRESGYSGAPMDASALQRGIYDGKSVRIPDRPLGGGENPAEIPETTR